jgi:hypothetical protein
MKDRHKKDGHSFLGGMWHASGNRSPFLYGMCLLFGLILLYAAFLQPLFMVYMSRSWTAASCTILSSGLKSGSGQQYAEEVVYSYEVAGKTYQADRYEFHHTWSKGRDRLQKEADLVARYRPGSQTTCYVNPHDPADAVLHRRIGAVAILFTAPLSFALIGVGVSGLKRRRDYQRQQPKRKARA